MSSARRSARRRRRRRPRRPRPDHRRRRLRRHQPRAPAARARAGRCSCSTTSRGPASSETSTGCASTHGERSSVDDRRHARRGRACATRSRARASVFHFAAQVAVTTSLDRSARRFRGQRARHAQRARGDPRASRTRRRSSSPRRTRCTAGSTTSRSSCDGQRYAPRRRAIARARHLARQRPLDFHSPYGCSKGTADQYVLDYARTLRPADGRVPHELHLRPAPVRHRGSGLGRALPACARSTASRSRSTATACRCATSCSSTIWSTRSCSRERNIDRARRPGVQHRRRPGEHDQPARAARPHRGSSTATPPDVELRGLAHRRPALLRLRHARASSGDRLGAARRRRARASRGCTTGCASRAALACAARQQPRQRARRAARRRREARMSCDAAHARRSRAAMRAGVIAAPRRAIAIADARSPAPGEVRVRLEGCGVCASNLPVWEGRAVVRRIRMRAGRARPRRLGRRRRGRRRRRPSFAVGDRVAALSYDALRRVRRRRRASAVVPLPAALDGVAVPGEPLGCAMNIFRRSEHRGRADGRDRRHRLPRRAAHAARGARRRAGDRDLAPAVRARGRARSCGAAETIPMDDH